MTDADSRTDTILKRLRDFPLLLFFLINHLTSPKLYRSYDPHRSRDSLSPVCGIFFIQSGVSQFDEQAGSKKIMILIFCFSLKTLKQMFVTDKSINLTLFAKSFLIFSRRGALRDNHETLKY